MCPIVNLQLAAGKGRSGYAYPVAKKHPASITSRARNYFFGVMTFSLYIFYMG